MVYSKTPAVLGCLMHTEYRPTVRGWGFKRTHHSLLTVHIFYFKIPSVWHLILKPFGIFQSKEYCDNWGKRNVRCFQECLSALQGVKLRGWLFESHWNEQYKWRKHWNAIDYQEISFVGLDGFVCDANIWRDYLYVLHIFWEGIQFICVRIYFTVCYRWRYPFTLSWDQNNKGSQHIVQILSVQYQLHSPVFELKTTKSPAGEDFLWELKCSWMHTEQVSNTSTAGRNGFTPEANTLPSEWSDQFGGGGPEKNGNSRVHLCGNSEHMCLV